MICYLNFSISLFFCSICLYVWNIYWYTCTSVNLHVNIFELHVNIDKLHLACVKSYVDVINNFWKFSNLYMFTFCLHVYVIVLHVDLISLCVDMMYRKITGIYIKGVSMPSHFCNILLAISIFKKCDTFLIFC